MTSQFYAPQSEALGFDKWALLDALRDARKAYGLKDRCLTVLRALLSCHPSKDLSTESDCVVFPSNETLSHRCDGMPESTLRRHLAQLVALGFIRREDSPSRKRYAHRTSEGLKAFGFDLSPLVTRANELAETAHHMRARLSRIKLLRDLIRLALKEAAQTPENRSLLRREDNLEDLEARHAALSSAENLSAETSHFERLNTKQESQVDKDMTPEAVLETYPELLDYTTAEELHAEGLPSYTNRILRDYGVKAETRQHLFASLTPLKAFAFLGYLLQKQRTIHYPNAYAKALLQRLDLGKFDLSALIQPKSITARS